MPLGTRRLVFAPTSLASSGPKNNQPPFSAHSRLFKTGGRRHPQAARRCRSAPPGFRDSGYNKAGGALWLVGYYGYSWSTAFAGSDARYLGFNYGFLARQASKTPCGRGFQLRCLQE